MATHFPTDNDEWMLREIKRLTQFTRIFPPEPSASSAKGGVGEKDEDEDNNSGDEEGDKEDGADGAAVTEGSASASKPVKSATYEEIMYQVI